jgi:hypothetical protein
MMELGMKHEIFGADKLRPFQGIRISNPVMPVLPPNTTLLCGFDQGLGERLLTIASLEDIRRVIEAYEAGFALRLHWYTGEDVGFVSVR